MDINKQYIQDSRKERQWKKIMRKERQTRGSLYISAKLSGIDLIERFSLYSDQNQIVECKIKMKQWKVNNNGLHIDINKYNII